MSESSWRYYRSTRDRIEREEKEKRERELLALQNKKRELSKDELEKIKRKVWYARHGIITPRDC